jgi:transmembrane sensor
MTAMPKVPVSEITALSDQAIDWVIRLNSGKATKRDRELAEQWQDRSLSHRKAFAEAEQLWLEMGEVLLSAEPVHIQAQAPVTAKPSRYLDKRFRGLAAAVILFALIAPFSGLSDRWFSDYYTGVGEQKTIALADGSQVTLNTDTALSVAFDASGRHLTLKRGQAVFNVAADPGRPFEVATDTAVVKALGTVFEVLKEPQGVRVTVAEHAVGIKGLLDKDYAGTSRVNAGQQALYSRKHGFEAAVTVDPQQNTAWQRGKLIFKDQPLAAVVAELDRYVPGSIAILNDKLRSLHVSGVFPMTDPAATLDMIEQILPVKIIRVTPWLTLLHS